MVDLSKLEHCIGARIELEKAFLDSLRAFQNKQEAELSRLAEKMQKHRDDVMYWQELMQKDDEFKKLVEDFNKRKKSSTE